MVSFVPEFFQIAHQVSDTILVRRDERRVGQAGAADPVLADAERARRLGFATYPLHQDRVCVA